MKIIRTGADHCIAGNGVAIIAVILKAPTPSRKWTALAGGKIIYLKSYPVEAGEVVDLIEREPVTKYVRQLADTWGGLLGLGEAADRLKEVKTLYVSMMNGLEQDWEGGKHFGKPVSANNLNFPDLSSKFRRKNVFPLPG